MRPPTPRDTLIRGIIALTCFVPLIVFALLGYYVSQWFLIPAVVFGAAGIVLFWWRRPRHP